MIKQEFFKTESGIDLVKTSSTEGMRIARDDGELFDNAIDPVVRGRTYAETDEPIQFDEATDADKDAALRGFGVEV